MVPSYLVILFSTMFRSEIFMAIFFSKSISHNSCWSPSKITNSFNILYMESLSILTQYIELVFEAEHVFIDNSTFLAYVNFHNLRSAGATCLPINSIARMSFAWGNEAGFIINVMREIPPRILLWCFIFSITSSGSPIRSAPSGPLWASKSLRVTGAYPRSLPISLKECLYPGKKSSSASGSFCYVVKDRTQASRSPPNTSQFDNLHKILFMK